MPYGPTWNGPLTVAFTREMLAHAGFAFFGFAFAAPGSVGGFPPASGAGFGPPSFTKPLVTFSAMNRSASAMARDSVNAKAESTLSGALRLGEKSVLQKTY